MPTLTAMTGPLAGQTFSFDGNVVVGRSQFADLALDDATVSRRHGQFRQAPDGYWLVDLGSTNGVKVNGERIDEYGPLRGQEVVAFGDLQLRYDLATLGTSGHSHVTVPARDFRGNERDAALLTRLARFFERGSAPEALAQDALAAVRDAFPQVARASLWIKPDMSPEPRPYAESRAAGLDTAASDAISAYALEALHHRAGLFALDADQRQALDQRLGTVPGEEQIAAIALRLGGEPTGVLILEGMAGAAPIAPTDRETLRAVASLFALGHGAARGTGGAIDSQDLRLARRIQQRFLPAAPPRVDGFQIVDSYTAARTVGGDHYDFRRLTDQRWCAIVADVSGKAVSGALYMARLGLHLELAARASASPGALLDALNTALYNELEPGMFVTVLAVALDAGRDELEIASAGHAGPLVRRRSGRIERPELPNGAPIGAERRTSYQTQVITLSVGDMALLYTDGLDEAHNARNELFGVGRIHAALAAADGARAATDVVMRALGGFVGDADQSDDITLIAIERSR